MSRITDSILPLMIAATLAVAWVRGSRIFELFLEGAKEGLQTTLRLIPTLVGLLTAVAMFRASGGLDVLVHALSPVARLIGLPEEVMPLALLRPVSGSGALAIMENIIGDVGPDSFAGRVAAVMMGSSETTFYAVATYLGSVGVRDTRHVIPAALAADLAGFIVSAVAVSLFFSS